MRKITIDVNQDRQTNAYQAVQHEYGCPAQCLGRPVPEELDFAPQREEMVV